MKKISLILLCSMLCMIVSCGLSTNTHERIVSVTIMPQKYFAEHIAGDKYEVHCVVPPNANPEAYDMTPAQMTELSKSVAYMEVGTLGFELSWMDRLQQNNKQMTVYNVSQGIEMIHGTHSHTHANGHVHNTLTADPHVWASPKNARIMARNMYDVFARIDPDNVAYYTARYDSLVQRIDSIDAVVTAILEPVKGRAFAIYHPSLTYLARDYGLTQICIENAGKESSAQSMKTIIDKARAADVKVVFVQKEFDTRQVHTFADELGAKVYTINPLSYNWESEIINIANAIAQE